MKKIKYLFLVLIVTTCFVIGNVIINAVSPFYNITGLYISTTQVEPGGRVYVDYMGQRDSSTHVTGYFICDTDVHDIGIELQDVTGNPYFQMPNNLKAGKTYTMTGLTITDSQGTVSYSLVPNGESNYMNPLGRNTVTINAPYKLSKLELLSEPTLTPNGSVRLRLETTVNCNYISVCLRNTSVPTMAPIVYLTKVSDNIYEIRGSSSMSDSITDGKYYISDVFLFDGTDTSNHFSSYSRGGTTMPLNYRIEINVSGYTTPETNTAVVNNSFLNGLEIKSTNAKLNETVNVTLNTSSALTSATLMFSNETESMTVNVKDLNTSEPYFVVPFTTNAGTYNLDYAILKDNDGNEYQYRKGEDYYTIKHFDFNSTLTVENQIAEGNLLNLDNSKITADIIEKIKDLDSNIVIEINAEEDPVVSKELFSAIQNSNKTLIFKYKDLEWTFNGLDIQNPKMIDVSTNIYNVSKDEKISSKVQNGLVLDFAANNELPGKCLIKVYNSDTIAKIINKDNANIYYYNEATDKFEVIKLNAEYNTNGYYEFYISHNSKYVITTDNIDSKYVTETAEENTMDVKTILTIAIPSAIILILLIVIIVLIVKVKKAKNNE